MTTSWRWYGNFSRNIEPSKFKLGNLTGKWRCLHEFHGVNPDLYKKLRQMYLLIWLARSKTINSKMPVAVSRRKSLTIWGELTVKHSAMTLAFELKTVQTQQMIKILNRFVI